MGVICSNLRFDASQTRYGLWITLGGERRVWEQDRQSKLTLIVLEGPCMYVMIDYCNPMPGGPSATDVVIVGSNIHSHNMLPKRDH
jgi:hypothetical protein